MNANLNLIAPTTTNLSNSNFPDLPNDSFEYTTEYRGDRPTNVWSRYIVDGETARFTVARENRVREMDILVEYNNVVIGKGTVRSPALSGFVGIPLTANVSVS